MQYALGAGAVVVCLCGNAVERISEVTLHLTGLVLGWVTVCVCNQPTGPTQSGHLSLNRRSEYWR